MKSKRDIVKYLCWYISALAFSTLALSAKAQTYVGLGYVEAYNITESVLDDARGVVITVQKEVRFGDSHWQLIPTLHAALLFSNLEDDNFPGYASTVSISPLVTYDLVRFKKITLAPYVGPSLSWLASLNADKVTADDILFVSDVRQISRLQGGFEVGLAAYFQIADEFRIKLVPLSVQYGQDSFRQGMIILSFEI